MINFDKHIWEGWTVGNFIEALQPQLDMIMGGGSWQKPFTTKAQLSAWCKDNQPYYKKPIADVNKYFAQRYGLK